MSKSLNYCKTIASDPLRSKYGDRDFSLAEEYNIEEIIKNFNSNIDKNNIKYSVCYDPEADFNYMICYSDINDGTLFFLYEGMEEVLNRVLSGSSYNISIGPPKENESVCYTVGNIIYIIEYDNKYALKNKPWLKQRNTIMLPVKYERSHLK